MQLLQRVKLWLPLTPANEWTIFVLWCRTGTSLQLRQRGLFFQMQMTFIFFNDTPSHEPRLQASPSPSPRIRTWFIEPECNFLCQVRFDSVTTQLRLPWWHVRLSRFQITIKCAMIFTLVFFFLSEVGMDSKLTKSIAKDVRKRVRSARTPAPDAWPVIWLVWPVTFDLWPLL